MNKNGTMIVSTYRSNGMRIRLCSRISFALFLLSSVLCMLLHLYISWLSRLVSLSNSKARNVVINMIITATAMA